MCPALSAGDVVLMHSACWHESGANTCGVDRIMADIIYCHRDDPGLRIPRDRDLFKRSRVSRIKELQAQLDATK